MKTRLAIFSILLMSLVSCGPNREKAHDYLKQGVSVFYDARYKKAIEFFDKAIDEYPDLDEAWYYRGASKFNIKDTKGALEDISKAIKLNPAYADAYSTRGDIEAYEKDHDAACKDWLEAERLGKPNMRDKTRNCK